MPLNNPFDFTGKSVILAGAAGGLGRPITIAFAQAGADLALCGRTEEKLAKLAEEIKGAKGRIFYSRADLCSPQETESFVQKVCERYQKIDVLVNLVGGIIRKPSLDYPLEEWQWVMDVNLKACWLSCRRSARSWSNRNSGGS